MSNNTPVYGAVLVKASQILDVLSKSIEPLTLNQIAQECHFTLSTTSKILDTLQLLEYVQRNPEDKKFSLGLRLIQYSNASLMQFDIIRDSYRYLKELYTQFEETVHLGMLHNNQIMYINKFSSLENNKQMASQIGGTRELYCSAMGKSILATFSNTQLKHYIDSVQLNPFTERTITSPLILEEEIMEVKRRGYAVDNREIEQHLCCFGASIQSPNSTEALYAFSVTIPVYRLNDPLQKNIIQQILDTKQKIEHALN